MAKKKRAPRYQLDRSKFLTEAEKLSLTKKPYTGPIAISIGITLLFATGARAEEMLSLCPKDIDHTTRSIEVTGIKGSLNRTIPLSDSDYQSICHYILTEQIKSSEPIVDVSYRTFLRYWIAIAPPGKTVHASRHTFAIELFKRTRDLRLVQIALGHVNIQNTMIYAQYVHSTEEIRSAMGV